MNYAKKDFSPIFPASIKPEHVGWYAASAGKSFGYDEVSWITFYWWDGNNWYLSDIGGVPAYPILWWFGLRGVK